MSAAWEMVKAGVVRAVRNPVTGSIVKIQAIDDMGGVRSVAFDGFVGKVDGAVGSLDSGQSYVLQHTLDANRLRIVSGRFTNVTTAASQAAGYAEVHLGSPVSRIGGEFEFGTKTTDNGSATFAVWTASYPGTGAVPDSPCHLSITTKKWTFSYFEGGSIIDLATGEFATELATDGTLYSAEVMLSGTTAYLTLPDSSRFKVSSPFIASNAGNVAVFEVFATNCSTDSKVKYSKVFADDSFADSATWKYPGRAEVYDKMAREIAAWLPTVAYYAPAVAANVTIPTTMTTLDATNLAVTFIAPPSGRVIISAQVFVLSTTRVLLAIDPNNTGVSATGSVHDLTGIAMNGVADYTAQVTGLTPGRSYKYCLRGQAITSTATLMADSPNGRVAWMKAQPY